MGMTASLYVLGPFKKELITYLGADYWKNVKKETEIFAKLLYTPTNDLSQLMADMFGININNPSEFVFVPDETKMD